MEEKQISKVYAGYDLGSEDCQISLYSAKTGKEPISVAAMLGGEKIRIPFVLAKKKGVEQWYYGEEAVRKAEQGEAVTAEGIYQKSLEKGSIELEDKQYEAEVLFQMYVKKTLGLLLSYVPFGSIDACTFCVERIDEKTVNLWKTMAETLPLKRETLRLISYSEGFAYYTAYQEESLWTKGVLLLDYDNNRLKTRILKIDKMTIPHLMKVEEKETAEMRQEDELFLNYLKQVLKDSPVSTVYLVGEGFREAWYPESLKLLCQGRRVFKGQNLYGLGALNYSGMKLDEKEQKCLYLGEEQIKVNFFLKAIYKGEETEYEFLSAELHWYEAEAEVEFIPDSQNEAAVYARGLDGKCEEIIRVPLHGFPVRAKKASRLKLKMYFKGNDTGVIEVTDMGFGEIYEASGKVWSTEFDLRLLEQKLNGSLGRI